MPSYLQKVYCEVSCDCIGDVLWLCQFMEVLDKVSAGCGLSGLLEVYNDQGYSDYLVVYLRCGSCH